MINQELIDRLQRIEDKLDQLLAEKQDKPKFTIKDLAEGKCAVINDGSLGQLQLVLEAAFPDDKEKAKGIDIYYYLSKYSNRWDSHSDTGLPTQSVKDFLMTFTQLEVQQIINGVLCAQDCLQYVEGKDLREKSWTLVHKVATIKEKTGTVTLIDIGRSITR